MSYDIKDFLKKFFSSRLFVLAAVFIVFFGIILARIFTLQVVNGKSYQENFSLKIQMKQPINAARGNIYDKNGKLLAYNELAYSISINDSTTYSSTKEKNKAVNAELAEILTVLKNNGETLNNDFKIDRKKDGTYSFNVSGSSLNRFRADVFGKSSADDLEYDKDTGIDEANATAEQIMEYLMGKYAINLLNEKLGTKFSEDEAGFIALHFVNAEYDTTINDTFAMTNMIQGILELVKQEMGIEFDEESLHYERFVTHLKFLAQRLYRHELLKDEEIEFAKLMENKYPGEYECSKHIAEYIEKEYGGQISGEEIMFLAIHIKRVCMTD